MKKPAGFSLMEMLIVVSILAVLIIANRVLFSLPSKYIIESEQCINTIHGEVNKFLLEAVTGKAKTESTTGSFSSTPEKYFMIFEGNNTVGSGKYGINFGFIQKNTSGENINSIEKTFMLGNTRTGNTVNGCLSDRHWLVLSGGISYGGGNYPIKVTINKNLSVQNNDNSMEICAADPGSSYNCVPGSEIFTGAINYFICKGNNSIYDINSCESFFTEYIDTRTQSIISRKCLSLPLERPCQRRSIGSGYNF